MNQRLTQHRLPNLVGHSHAPRDAASTACGRRHAATWRGCRVSRQAVTACLRPQCPREANASVSLRHTRPLRVTSKHVKTDADCLFSIIHRHYQQPCGYFFGKSAADFVFTTLALSGGQTTVRLKRRFGAGGRAFSGRFHRVTTCDNICNAELTTVGVRRRLKKFL